eukprot:16437488-Heterocapsa_arctica.AAC.1
MASMERRIADAEMKRNRANNEAAIHSGNVSGFGKVAAPATTNPPGKKAVAKAAAKAAAKALAAS